MNADTKLSAVLPLIDCELTIQEIAERLGISVEAVWALVAAANLSSSLARTQ